MRKVGRITGLAMFLLALFIVAACSQQDLKTFFRNITANDCATPAAQQAALANLPQVVVGLTSAQEAVLLQNFCAGEFGTTAAPTPAPGMEPAIPGPATPTPVATPAPSALPTPAA